MPIPQMEPHTQISRTGAFSLPLHLQHTSTIAQRAATKQEDWVAAEIRVLELLIIILQLCIARYHFLAVQMLTACFLLHKTGLILVTVPRDGRTAIVPPSFTDEETEARRGSGKCSEATVLTRV